MFVQTIFTNMAYKSIKFRILKHKAFMDVGISPTKTIAIDIRKLLNKNKVLDTPKKMDDVYYNEHGQMFVSYNNKHKKEIQLLEETLDIIKGWANVCFAVYEKRRKFAQSLVLDEDTFNRYFIQASKGILNNGLTIKFCQFIVMQMGAAEKQEQFNTARNLNTCKQHFQKFLQKNFMQDDISPLEITPYMANTFKGYLESIKGKNGVFLKNSTIETYLQYLQLMFEKYFDVVTTTQEVIDFQVPRNPFEALQSKKEKKTDRIKSLGKSSKKDYLTYEDIELIANTEFPAPARHNGIDLEFWKRIVLIQQMLGTRIGELCKLQVQHIDFEDNTFVVYEDKGIKKRYGRLRDLYGSLQYLKDFAEGKRSMDYILPLIRTTFVLDEEETIKEINRVTSNFNYALNLMLKHLGINKKITTHSNRLAFINSFDNLEIASKAIGHSSSGITKQHYRDDDLLAKEQLEAFNKNLKK
jgi:integrase